MTDKLKMKVTGLTIDPFTNMPIIVLKDDEEKTALPLWIGLVEASSIATVLEKLEINRPMTHDLMENIINHLGSEVHSVQITDMIDNTFYSNIIIKKEETLIEMDARPSDAIALALRVDADIFVHRNVIEKSRRIEVMQKLDQGDIKGQQWAEVLENLSPEDFGKYKM